MESGCELTYSDQSAVFTIGNIVKLDAFSITRIPVSVTRRSYHSEEGVGVYRLEQPPPQCRNLSICRR